MEIHVSLPAETLFHLGPVPVTNSMLVMFLVMAALLIIGSWLARKAQSQPIPGRAAGVAELIVEFLLNLVESTAGKRIGRRVLPLVAGLFIFILFSNFTGLLPGVGSIYIKGEEAAHEEVAAEEATHEEAAHEEGEDEAHAVAGEAVADEAHAEEEVHAADVPIFRPPTADLNMTLAMSTLTFVVVQIAGVSAHGVGGRIKHMANPPFLFPIEVISELSRIISLAARLFGNVFAGEVLLGVMYAMAASIKIAVIPVLFPVVFLGLETLFGTIQALVFALLTLIYIYLAAAGHDDYDEEHVENHDAVRAVDDRARDAGTVPASAGD
jgi:F-type H+-transporting ATPase subunit a